MSKISENSYYVVHKWMLSELGLSGTELSLYAIIHGFSQPGSDQCFSGGINYLSEMTGKDRSSVIRNLQSLVSKGHLEKKEIDRNGVKFCKYRVAVVKQHPDVEMQLGVAKCDGGSGKMRPNNKDNNKVSKDKSLDTKKEREADFEIFWKAYPKKKGKQDALKAFLKVKVPLVTLLTSLEKQKRSADWQKDGGQYVPYPATWLNGARWEDEIDNIFPNTPERPRQRRLIGTEINEYGEEVNVYEYV